MKGTSLLLSLLTLVVAPAQTSLAYENILLYGEHTWGRSPQVNQYGGAFKTASPQLIADLEASWEDKTDYIREASRIARGITAGNLQALAGAVASDAPCVVVYNPLPWPRSGHVEVNGETVFVKDVPPCGYRTYPLPPASIKAAPRTTTGPATLENDFFKLTLDPAKGAISSLVDKRTGREWVDPTESRAPGSYLNERFTYEQTLNYTVAYQAGRAFKSFGAEGEWPHPGMHKPGMVSEKQVPYRAALSGKGTATIDGDSAIIECALEARNPLLAVGATGSGGRLPAEQSGLSLSRKGIVVTAFGENPDGEGTLLRVWEMAGIAGDLTITLPGKFTSATPVSLRGEKLGDTVPISNGTLTCDLPGFAPVSFLLNPAPTPKS